MAGTCCISALSGRRMTFTRTCIFDRKGQDFRFVLLAYWEHLVGLRLGDQSLVLSFASRLASDPTVWE